MSSANSATSVDQDVTIVSSATMGSSAATAIPLSPGSTSANPPKPKTPIKQGAPIKQVTPVKQIIASPTPVSSGNKARTQVNATSPLKNSQSSPPSALSSPFKVPAKSASPMMNNKTPSRKPVAAKATSVSDGSDRSDPSDDEDYSEYEYSPKSESTDSNAGTPGSTNAQAKPASPLKRVASRELCPTPTPPKKAKKPTGTIVPRPLRRAPTFKANASGSNAGSGSDFFSSTVFEVNVGTNGFKAIAHEGVLSKSPLLTEEMIKARARPQKVYQQIIHLPPHDKDDFGQMMDFLYKDKLALRPSTAVPDRLKELRGVMTLAFIYQLPELQRQVTQAFVRCELLQKMPAPSFFDFAEDMFYRQTDLFKGPWTKYFHHVAPGLIKGHQVKESRGELKQKDAEDFIDRMCAAIWLGSLFAVELYRAQNNALKLTEDNYMNVKMQKIKKELMIDDNPHGANQVTLDS